MSLLVRKRCSIVGYNDQGQPIVTFPDGLAPRMGDSLEITMQKLLAAQVVGSDTIVVDHENPVLPVWDMNGFGAELREVYDIQDGVVVGISYIDLAGNTVTPAGMVSHEPSSSPVKIVYRLGGEAGLDGILAKPEIPTWVAGGGQPAHTQVNMVPGDHVILDYPRYGVSWEWMRETDQDPGDSTVSQLINNGRVYLPGGSTYSKYGSTENISADTGSVDFSDSYEVVGGAFVEITVWVSKSVALTLTH